MLFKQKQSPLFRYIGDNKYLKGRGCGQPSRPSSWNLYLKCKCYVDELNVHFGSLAVTHIFNEITLFLKFLHFYNQIYYC